eukprot:TRINITY_DN15308_c0_g1_i1.p12 TRINITY_DN15308_c0_g1~~TRINITY_DN15308_c0_g1_i1.p12  ORF type:complete len:100 (-),score=8.14 TRINITY_DN15308_c0_g1_i1:79-378(-)
MPATQSTAPVAVEAAACHSRLRQPFIADDGFGDCLKNTFTLRYRMDLRCTLAPARAGHVPPCTPVSYTHLTLPTICSVQISVVAVSLKKKKINAMKYSG